MKSGPLLHCYTINSEWTLTVGQSDTLYMSMYPQTIPTTSKTEEVLPVQLLMRHSRTVSLLETITVTLSYSLLELRSTADTLRIRHQKTLSIKETSFGTEYSISSPNILSRFKLLLFKCRCLK